MPVIDGVFKKVKVLSNPPVILEYELSNIKLDFLIDDKLGVFKLRYPNVLILSSIRPAFECTKTSVLILFLALLIGAKFEYWYGFSLTTLISSIYPLQ